jgi:Phosphate-starvation-inducible E.
MTKESLLIVSFLERIVSGIVLVLAFMMIPVLIWGVIDVGGLIYRQILTEPWLTPEIDHLLDIFGAFLTVLIGIEIFLNIIFYITEKQFHVKLVVATALTAVVRKVIILDYHQELSLLIFATAAVVLAVSISYWIASKVNA